DRPRQQVRARPADGARLAGFALFEPVDLRAAAGVELALHAREADVDAAPARRDQVDEQRQVVDSRVPLSQEVDLEPFQAPDRLTREPAHLGELLRNRSRFGANAVPYRLPDLPRERGLERSGALGELLDLRPRPLGGRFDAALRRPAPSRVLESFACP